MKNKIYLHDCSFFKNKKIIKKIILSESFGMRCERIIIENNESYIVKSLEVNNTSYNALIYERKSLQYMFDKFPHLFPKVLYFDNKILIMEYLENNKIKGKYYEKELLNAIVAIHKVKNKRFGFDYDTPIGALKQPSEYNNNWVDFYKEKRLGMIFNLINKINPMPKNVNSSIENILKNIENILPKNPTPSLIHGDLWEGNILFNNGKLMGLIDPGIHFAHNELEIAYLTFFNYVSNDFLRIYSNIIKLDEEYYNYEPIYQLYYCLLNVHLWDRSYIKNTIEIINKVKL